MKLAYSGVEGKSCFSGLWKKITGVFQEANHELTVLFSLSMATSASSGFSNVTNPKPLDLPVSRSWTTIAESDRNK